MRTQRQWHILMRSRLASRCAWVAGSAAALALTAGSAIVAKEATAPPLVVVERLATPAIDTESLPVPSERLDDRAAVVRAVAETVERATEPPLEESIAFEPAADAGAMFNGRPIRPARVVWMQVTAYSPGAESCAPFNDGRTATLHSVWTNAMKLVAADTSILPFGSLVSVPGYDQGRVVPVLDRGAAIKGYELDVLFPTARQARAWGVRKLPIVIWEYADGEPLDDPRRFR